jgi:hypothetical protein
MALLLDCMLSRLSGRKSKKREKEVGEAWREWRVVCNGNKMVDRNLGLGELQLTQKMGINLADIDVRADWPGGLSCSAPLRKSARTSVTTTNKSCMQLYRMARWIPHHIYRSEPSMAVARAQMSDVEVYNFVFV